MTTTTEAVMDELEIQARIDSAVAGALVFADKMAEAVSEGDFVGIVVMAGQYREIRRVMRQLRALKAEVVT